MKVDPPSGPQLPPDVSATVSDVVELLEVLWEQGREISSAPVSPSQLRVLYVVERAEGINLRTLAEALGSSAPSVSRLCDRLQAVGYLERTPSRASRRELELRLTGHGRAYLDELRSRREIHLAAVISAMEPGARRALLKGLAGFRDSMEASSQHGHGHSSSSSVRDGRSA